MVIDPLVDVRLPVSNKSANGYVWQFTVFATPAGDRRDGGVELFGSLSGGG